MKLKFIVGGNVNDTATVKNIVACSHKIEKQNYHMIQEFHF